MAKPKQDMDDVSDRIYQKVVLRVERFETVRLRRRAGAYGIILLAAIAAIMGSVFAFILIVPKQ